MFFNIEQSSSWISQENYRFTDTLRFTDTKPTHFYFVVAPGERKWTPFWGLGDEKRPESLDSGLFDHILGDPAGV